MTTSQAVDRALTALWILNGSTEATVTQVAEELQVHKSTASRLLVALEKHHLVERCDDSSAYQLGQGILQLAGSVSVQRDFTKSAQALCGMIADKLEITSNIAILDDMYAVNVVQASGSSSFLQPRQYVGRRTPGHATSSGKILIAHAPVEQQQKILSSELERFTDNTIVDPAELLKELELTKGRNWAASNQEWEAHMTAVAVPVKDTRGDVIAAATITGHPDQLPPEQFATKATEMQKLVARFGILLD